jgi:GNAT superfamily N-acetyltransferase
MNEADAMKVTIKAGDPEHPDVLALLRRSEEESHALYGGACHTLSVKELAYPAVRFLVASTQGEVVGCGALLHQESYAEVKRMFVTPTARRRGVGAEILKALERVARAEGVQTLLLETGEKQPAAVALYRSFGYRDRGVFGDYGDNPLSIYMEKRLEADEGARLSG